MKIILFIASTTHIDRHNDRMSKEALEDGLEQIRAKFIPYLFNHDLNKQIGVVLNGRVLQLEDGEFALYTVAGIFENQKEKQKYPIGEKNIAWKDYENYLDGVKDLAEIKKDISGPKIASKMVKEETIADLLAVHLDSTQVLPDGRVYKIKHFINSVKDLQIHVYKDHNPPHFHIISKQRGIDARFYIDRVEYMNIKNGKIREKDIKKIKNFFKLRPDILKKLRDEHKRMNS